MTFDIDTNGILNISVVDTSKGKGNKITITNDKGRLSKKDIERMLQDANKYKADDNAQGEKIAAKSSLESYTFNMKSSFERSTSFIHHYQAVPARRDDHRHGLALVPAPKAQPLKRLTKAKDLYNGLFKMH